MFFLIAIITRISFRLSIPKSQYKLYLAYVRFQFPKNSFLLYNIEASSSSPDLSAKIVHYNHLLQFYYFINMNDF